MVSRTYPGWLVGILAVVAAGGWLAAWNKGDGGKGGAEPSAETRSSRKLQKSRTDRAASPVDFVADGDTARVLSSFEAIHDAAVPGQVNQRLLHACRGALLDGNTQRRARNYSLLLQLMRAEDGPALHEQFLELHREGKTYDEYKEMANRWGELDAPGAIQYLSSQKPSVLPPDDFRAVVRGWGQKDPEAAIAWMDGNPEMAARMNGRAAVLEGWIREDPEPALKWIEKNLEKLEGRDYFEALRVGVANQISGGGSGAADAADWLTSRPQRELSAPASAMAWESMQWALGEMPYDKAAAVWGKVGGQEWMSFREFGGFFGAISNNRSADQGMEGFLGALEKTWPAEQITSQFHRWTLRDPQATVEWLKNVPSSSVTQAAIEGAVKALEQTDPQAAAEWAAKLEK